MRELEAGDITFYAQTRRTDDEIAHVFFALRPWTGGERAIIIGRKHIARRFWALVVDRLADRMEEIGEGDYRIYEHDGHSHLAYELSRHVDDAMRREIGLARAGGFIITVMNPDPALWTEPVQEELFPGYVASPTPFPAELQDRFAGRKYAKLDTTEFLDYPGAELVLISE
jgi:hypothetical protein